PLGLAPGAPDQLPSLAEQRATVLLEPARSQFEQEVWDFRHAHDLAFGLQGLGLRALWIVAQGRMAWASSTTVRALLPKDELFGVLGQLGEAVAERLKTSLDSRAQAAMQGWSKRTVRRNDELAAIYAGTPLVTLHNVAGKDPFWKAFEVPSAGPFEQNEMLAVARGLRGAVSAKELQSILGRVRRTRLRATPKLDGLSSAAEAILRQCATETWAEQGKLLAIWFREQLALGTGPVDAGDLLKKLGVPPRRFELSASHVDALSVWGRRHGPTVLLNRIGRHAQTAPGANATLAHELCHLIVDRRAALPFGEVFTRTPLPLESRANAFAAELLVPTTIVAAAFAQAANPTNPTKILKQLGAKYTASAEVIAWQARNSGVELSDEAHALLRGKVSRPELF
ncbi:MAG: ImmA/IrrE family metallo-endopeptidase, partial [Myxococcota bacterium]|nr:ImmA/IrrE family metallo-endopeptidase [Myxococcota bacterium]